MTTAAELLQRHGIEYVATRKGSFTTTCPNCNGGYLNVKIKPDGAVWYCHACSEGGRDKYEKADRSGDLGPIKAIYDYQDENGERLFQVLRYEPVNAPKQFRQRTRPDQKEWSIKGVRIVPYRLPELIEAVAMERTVFIVEGERDVGTLHAHRVPASCNPMGAGKWRPDFAPLFTAADVVIIADNDKPGHDHVCAVADSLLGVARRVRLLDLAKVWPEIEVSDDITDWFERGGGTVERLWEIVEQLPDWTPAATTDDEPTRDDTAEAPPASLGIWNAGRDVELPPPRGWLLGNSFCRKLVSSLLGDGGAGKTALRILQALSLATGRKLTGEHVFHRTRILIVSFEDDAAELRRRVLAARLHYDIPASELDGWLFLSAPGGAGGKLMAVNGKSGALAIGTLPALIEAAARDHGVGLVVLDPFIKAHSVPENANTEMDAVAQLATDLAAKLDIALDLPHHISKGPADPGNANRGRGASATKDAGRLAYTLSPMSPEEAQRFNVPEDDRRGYVRLDRAKLNVARSSGPATWFKLVGVQLANGNEMYPNGDEVHTVELWNPPDTWAGMSSELLNRILTALDTGLDDGTFYTTAPKATTRAAWQVVRKFAPDKTEGQAREIIQAWIRTGLLIEFDYDNHVTRKPAKGLKVDSTKRPS